jgi:uncharacterized protein YuzE
VALNTLEEAKKMVSHLLNIPFKRVWSSYDEGADVLYLNFKKPAHADDSKMTADDIIVRYEKGEIIGITILKMPASVLRKASFGISKGPQGRRCKT